MLVINSYTLKPINFLYLVHQIFGQGHFTLDVHNILRVCTPGNQRITRLYIITIINRNMLPLWNGVFFLSSDICRGYGDFLSSLCPFRHCNISVDLGQHTRIFWFSDFKKFGNPWKTTGNIFGFCGCPGQFCNYIPGHDLFIFFNRKNGIYRQIISGSSLGIGKLNRLSLFVLDGNSGSNIRIFPFCNGTRNLAGYRVNLLLDRIAYFYVGKSNTAGDFRDNRRGKRIPSGNHIPWLDLLTSLKMKGSTIDNRLLRSFTSFFSHDGNSGTFSVHYDDVIISRNYRLDIFAVPQYSTNSGLDFCNFYLS